MNIELLELELDQLLKDQPHLMDLQLRVSRGLARLDNPQDRMYYMSIELFDSFYDLKEHLDILDTELKGVLYEEK
jgi:hypothetical protein